MQDRPSAQDLVAVVADLIRHELLPKLDGRAAFDARVAANVLDIVARELRLGPRATTAEQKRLATLLNVENDAATLNLMLCERLRDGSVTLATPGVLEHLRATTLEKLSIDQPGYATYRRILERGWGGVPADANGEEDQTT